MHKTGNYVKILDELGELEYICRKDNQAQINGYRVELEEIEKKVRMQK